MEEARALGKFYSSLDNPGDAATAHFLHLIARDARLPETLLPGYASLGELHYMQIDNNAHESGIIFSKDKALQVPGAQYKIFKILAENYGEPVEIETFLKARNADDTESERAHLYPDIIKLRKLLNEFGTHVIQTVIRFHNDTGQPRKVSAYRLISKQDFTEESPKQVTLRQEGVFDTVRTKGNSLTTSERISNETLTPEILAMIDVLNARPTVDRRGRKEALLDPYLATVCGVTLRAWRYALGLSEIEFALKAGLKESGRSHISKIESGMIQNPTREVLEKLASTIGITVNDLVNGKLPQIFSEQ